MFFSVAFARCADVREVIERRRDADGVREKSRDRDEEQDVTRTVTVRSHHEMIRVSDRRVCYPQYRQDKQLVPESPETSGLTSMHQESTIRMQAPGKYPGTCQSQKASNVPSGATIEEATALLESYNATFVRTVSMSASYYLCASYLSYFVSPDARDSQVAVQQATAAEESRPPFIIRLSSVKV